MSAESLRKLRAIRATPFDMRAFTYALEDQGSAAWYRDERYPGFRDEDYAIFEAFSGGLTAKQHRNLLKKQQKHDASGKKRCSA